MSLRKENHIYKSTIVLYFLILHARISDGSSFTKKRKKRKKKKKLCAFRDWTTRLYYLCIKSKNTNTLLFNLCTSVGRKFICHDSLSCFFSSPYSLAFFSHCSTKHKPAEKAVQCPLNLYHIKSGHATHVNDQVDTCTRCTDIET